ncbi:MAG: hypothetical protein H6631_12230 [Anaerolineaceae bacterium]|nr:hypothetical protein [Anaerolineaceae bacterium]MCB9098577.1 hypothetical protein [Anaerolineales bacterium]
MLKQRIITILAGIALTLVVTASSGVVTDVLGLSLTPQAHACEASGSSGGGC